jgi:hypothetical protein
MTLLLGAQAAPGLPPSTPSPKTEDVRDLVSLDPASHTVVLRGAEGEKTVDIGALGPAAFDLLAPGQGVRTVPGSGGTLAGLVIARAPNPLPEDTSSLAQVLPGTTAQVRVVVVDVPGRRLLVREGGEERLVALEGLAGRTVAMAEPGQDVLLYLKDKARASAFVITGWPSP